MDCSVVLMLEIMGLSSLVLVFWVVFFTFMFFPTLAEMEMVTTLAVNIWEGQTLYLE